MSEPKSAPHPPLIRNPLSLIGILGSVSTFVVTLTLIIVDFFTVQANPYLGIFVYLILPLILLMTLLLIPMGMWRERQRRRRDPSARILPFPHLDLNIRRHQIGLMIFVVGTVMTLTLLSVAGYRAYHFTDSVAFCGKLCHTVMKPEYTAYLYSPHARVSCASCHVGPGASWFVHSKLSGMYQVYSVTFKKYPRPIQTPVKNLRPAQDICEQCHWPAKFFGAQQKIFAHYLADEKNSPWQIQMLIKVGGGDPAMSATTGIHWHMNIKNNIDYIATDEKREVIPWVRSTDPKGHTTEYVTTESPLTPEQITKAQIRRMDCMDCHNRPSHIFNAPDRALDQAFFTGRIDTSLPYLKKQAILLLTKGYTTEEEAQKAVLTGLSQFYQENYPTVFQQKGVSIRQATEEVLRIYKTNFFPYMKVDWRTHPDHLGHLNSDGCFRCHDGLHKSTNGKVITRDCNACHTILGQGKPEDLAKTPPAAQSFRHPVDVGMDVAEEKCSICHTGAGGQ